MNTKELRHRIERSQQELEYWHSRADQMRSVLDHLETDYLTHRTDCFLVRQHRLRQAVARTLDDVAALQGGGGGGGRVPDIDVLSATSSGRSTPTETASLLPSPQPPSTVTAADFGRTVRRLAKLSHLKSTLTAVKRVTIVLQLLTPSTLAVPNRCCSKGSAPYWSNPPFLILTFGRSGAQD